MCADSAQQSEKVGMHAKRSGVGMAGHGCPQIPIRKGPSAIVFRKVCLICLHPVIVTAAFLFWNWAMVRLGSGFILASVFVMVLPVYCVVAGIVCLVVDFVKGRDCRGAIYLTVIATYVIGTFTGLLCLVHFQYDGTVRRGRLVGQAIIRFREDRGRYPATLDELKPDYVTNVPRYWSGVFPVRYSYWLDREGKPQLVFHTVLEEEESYDFKTDRWSR